VNTSTALVVGFDGTSRVPGASQGASAMWRALAGGVRGSGSSGSAIARWEPVGLGLDTKNSAIWARRVRQIARERSPRLLVGGEHMLTFPLLEAAATGLPGLRVVVLDAHHDAYEYPLLTHYSVFHHVLDELCLPVMVVGARHELALANPKCTIVSADEFRLHGAAEIGRRVAAFVGGHPFHFSIDVDVIDPGELPAVGDPVAGGLAIADVAALAHGILAAGPVSVDIVEYNALLDRSGQCLAALDPLLTEVRRWMA
jgi:arginase family enzyme